ncbi:hypothetical protein AX17_001569 [Amanita inopinata Kibby_2008]|nr:hypothetical protein AX17_001569 [Amanita inopinata Kibby_2008]
MLAAYSGHTSITEDLLSRGADPNRLNDRGQSVVAGAIFKGHDDIVRLLMEKGADPRIGRPTAIETARVFGKGEEMLKVLGATEEDMKSEVPGPLMLPGGVGNPNMTQS